MSKEEVVEPEEEVQPEEVKEEKFVLTKAQKEAGQTVEEAKVAPVEGAQIHNQ